MPGLSCCDVRLATKKRPILSACQWRLICLFSPALPLLSLSISTGTTLTKTSPLILWEFTYRYSSTSNQHSIKPILTIQTGHKKLSQKQPLTKTNFSNQKQNAHKKQHIADKFMLLWLIFNNPHYCLNVGCG